MSFNECDRKLRPGTPIKEIIEELWEWYQKSKAEEELREAHPGIQEAWEKYQILKILADKDNGEK